MSGRRSTTARGNGARNVKAREVAVNSDDEFWNQEAFEDEDDDESFNDEELSDKGEDIIDSDFDEPEDDLANEDDKDGDGAMRSGPSKPRARTGNYVDPALKKPRNTANAGDGPERPAKRAKTQQDGDDAARSVERKSLRRSTKAASELADRLRIEREADQDERRMLKREREKDKIPVKALTQEELLKEAEETAVKNTADLQVLLRLEEERKRLPRKPVADQEQKMSITSRDGKTLISFTEKDIDARSVLFPQTVTEDSSASGQHVEPVAGASSVPDAAKDLGRT